MWYFYQFSTHSKVPTSDYLLFGFITYFLDGSIFFYHMNPGGCRIFLIWTLTAVKVNVMESKSWRYHVIHHHHHQHHDLNVIISLPPPTRLLNSHKFNEIHRKHVYCESAQRQLDWNGFCFLPDWLVCRACRAWASSLNPSRFLSFWLYRRIFLTYSQYVPGMCNSVCGCVWVIWVSKRFVCDVYVWGHWLHRLVLRRIIAHIMLRMFL